ncbi:MAG: substrate-binding domain-containing protein [Verrucomicrobia bacterium]|nr:substrate-binding domain-containing protein [Verrucomicrobiota bacterium]
MMLDIVQRIERGEWKGGDIIPSVTCLADQYSFNRLTILKALNHLAHEGYLSVEQGRGTFVKASRSKTCIGMLFATDVFHEPSTRIASLWSKAAQEFFHGRDEELKFYVDHSHLFAKDIPNHDLFNDVERGNVRGLITVESNALDVLARSSFWKNHRVPLVAITMSRAVPHTVRMDRRAMTEMGLEFIQQRGGHRVGVIGFSKPSFDQEHAHFLAQAAACNLQTRLEWTPPHAAYNEEEGYRNMLKLWECPEKPDALLITDDIMGKGVVQALLQLNVQVPRQLLIVCHANKTSGIFYPIPLPKIEFNPADFIARAGAMLFELMENPFLPARAIDIPPTLQTADAV